MVAATRDGWPKEPVVRRIKLADIDTGGRHRKDMGDIDGLARTIAFSGLLQAVVVVPSRGRHPYRLVAGERRLRAVASLGWEDVPAHVVTGLDDAASLLRAECDENFCRKEFTGTEVVAIGEALEGAERAKAKERQRAGGRAGGEGSGKLPEAGKGQVRDKVAEVLGVSPRNYAKMKEVVQAAKADPDTYGDLAALVDVPGKVHQAHQGLKRRQKRKELQARAAAAPRLDADTCEVMWGDIVRISVRQHIADRRFRLAVPDPPYNQGVDYGGGAKADQLPEPEYLEELRKRLTLTAQFLTDDGSMWVIINHEHAADVEMMFRGGGLLHLRQRVTWYETFGNNHADGFNRCSRTLLWFVRDPGRFVFNADAVNRPSDRQEKYNDRRADPAGKNWDDVWGINPPIPRLTDTCKERIPGFPTQLPLALLRPIIGCCSDPGDSVLDPYCGSATAGEVALELGRRFVGIEENAGYARLASDRLRRAAAEAKAEAKKAAADGKGKAKKGGQRR
jgi:site-specific DNA-methyltransferase (adenine-specific)